MKPTKKDCFAYTEKHGEDICAALKPEAANCEKCVFYKPRTEETAKLRSTTGKRAHMTEEERHEVVEMYKDGVSLRGIAAAIGKSIHTVNKVIRERLKPEERRGRGNAGKRII